MKYDLNQDSDFKTEEKLWAHLTNELGFQLKPQTA